jgi:hypothetical protein
MYFFDPHAGTDKQFLQNASFEQPGRKFPLLGKNPSWLRDHVKVFLEILKPNRKIPYESY